MIKMQWLSVISNGYRYFWFKASLPVIEQINSLCNFFNLYNIFPKPLRWYIDMLNDRSAIA